MKKQALFKSVLLVSLVILLVSSVLLQAAEDNRPRTRGGRGLFGDWDLKIKFGERDMDAILSFSRDEEGNLTADWISFWGVNQLQDVKFEEGKLTFVQVIQFGDQEMRSTFSGTVDDQGELKGTLSGERGDTEVTGKRAPRFSRAAGIWDLKYKAGERDITSTLVIKTDKEGQLIADWKNDQVENEVTDVNYQRGTISLKRKTKMGDQQWDSSFEGTIDRQTGALTGTITSEMGSISVEGTRVGQALIGAWDLDIAADQRDFKQRLRVNPDMSAVYGTMPIEKVELKDGKVTFKTSMTFGDRTFDLSFDGKLQDDKLTGQITTSRGTQKVEGKKIVRSFMRRPTTGV